MGIVLFCFVLFCSVSFNYKCNKIIKALYINIHKYTRKTSRFLIRQWNINQLLKIHSPLHSISFFLLLFYSVCLSQIKFFLYLVLPKSNGRYLYLIICCICLLMVKVNNIIKYIKSIGQNTGISKILKMSILRQLLCL